MPATPAEQRIPLTAQQANRLTAIMNVRNQKRTELEVIEIALAAEAGAVMRQFNVRDGTPARLEDGCLVVPVNAILPMPKVKGKGKP